MNRVRLVIAAALTPFLLAASPASAFAAAEAPPLVCVVAPEFDGDAICVYL